MKKKIIVISAVSLFSGGTLSILFDCLTELDANFSEQYSILAFTNKNYSDKFPNIHFLPIRWARKSYFHRLFIEYILFGKIAKRLSPYLWLSLHDITPSVNAERIAVYCHHPSPFYKLSLKEYIFDPKFVFFSKVYSLFYKKNIHKNFFVIVQQSWLRDIFHRNFKLEKNKIIVAHPSVTEEKNSSEQEPFDKITIEQGVKYFFYPSFPRIFKNFEVIGESVRLLNASGYKDKFKVILTINSKENLYSRWLTNKYNYPNIDYIGRISREEVFRLYQVSDALLFPSKLETWGLPLTEYKCTNKPIIAANLEYAKEAIGKYDNVSFFNTKNSIELFQIMKCYLDNDISFTGNSPATPEEPFTSSWFELINKLTN